MLLWASLTLRHISTIRSPFSSRLIMSNFSSVLIVFHRFFTWIVQGNADLHFSLILVWKANAVEEETKWAAAWLYHQYNQSIHVTDGMTVTSLPASLLQKISMTTNCLCQIALNRNLLRKFEKWCKFSSRVEAKSRKMKLRKTRITVLYIFIIMSVLITLYIHFFVLWCVFMMGQWGKLTLFPHCEYSVVHVVILPLIAQILDKPSFWDHIDPNSRFVVHKAIRQLQLPSYTLLPAVLMTSEQTLLALFCDSKHLISMIYSTDGLCDDSMLAKTALCKLLMVKIEWCECWCIWFPQSLKVHTFLDIYSVLR
jgi:hypothetical protein